MWIIGLATLVALVATVWRMSPANVQPKIATNSIPTPLEGVEPPPSSPNVAAQENSGYQDLAGTHDRSTARSAIADSSTANPIKSERDSIATSPPAVELPGTIVEALDEVQRTLRDYRSSLGENPVGTNAEITQALLGDNLKQVRLVVPAGSNINGNGEMVDRWGTPYFFHQLSKNHMEIRSAGPDRQMWTADDSQM